MDKILYHPTPGTTGFFLMKEVMKEPSEKDYSGDQWKEYDAHVNYGFHIEERKEEAIKNGEITNPELFIMALYGHETIVDMDKYIKHYSKNLKPGDMFDVPEGLEFVKGLVNGKNYVRLVPSKKEEKVNGRSTRHCQSEIEGSITCAIQCDHCKEYYKPLYGETQDGLFEQLCQIVTDERTPPNERFELVKSMFTITRNSK